jgi:hypothetical protein
MFAIPFSFGGVHQAVNEVVNVYWANNLTAPSGGRNKWKFPDHLQKPTDIVFLIAAVDHRRVQHNAPMIATKK